MPTTRLIHLFRPNRWLALGLLGNITDTSTYKRHVSKYCINKTIIYL